MSSTVNPLYAMLLCLHLMTQSIAQSCSSVDGTVTVPPLFSLGQTTAQFTSCATGHDSPKLSPINESVYDWWYFDAVSSSGTESLVAVFYTSSELGFIPDLASVTSATSITLFATYADGTSSTTFLDAAGATITTAGDGASGNWTGVGAFQGAEDLSTYNFTIDDGAGISGSFMLQSNGPGHYPCSPLVAGAQEQLIPHVGWVNVVPAATGMVDFTIDGKTVNFEGSAYHDKNWGDIPFTSAVDSWYWGHGTLGPYDIVWFDAIDKDGVESVSGYVVQNGEAVGSTCDSLVVRPVGTVYPPTIVSVDPTQYTITMLLDDGRNLTATVTTERTQVALDLYSRWTGSMQGTIGDETYTGVALWEQFKLTL